MAGRGLILVLPTFSVKSVPGDLQADEMRRSGHNVTFAYILFNVSSMELESHVNDPLCGG